MPGIDGMEAAHRLRRLDQKVILVFVTNMASYAVKGYEVNATDYIVKPVYYGDFELKLKRVLAGYQAASEAILVVRQGGYVRLYSERYITLRYRDTGLCITQRMELLRAAELFLRQKKSLRIKAFAM